MVLEPARGIVCVEAHAHNAGTDSAPDIGISPDIQDRRPVTLVPTPQNEPLGLNPLGKPSGLLLRLVLATPAHWSPGPVTAPRRPTRVVSGAAGLTKRRTSQVRPRRRGSPTRLRVARSARLPPRPARRPAGAAEPRPAPGERRTVLLRIPLGMEKIRHACTLSDAPRAKTPRRRTYVSLATRAAPASPGYAGGSSNPDIGPRRQHSAVFR